MFSGLNGIFGMSLSVLFNVLYYKTFISRSHIDDKYHATLLQVSIVNQSFYFVHILDCSFNRSVSFYCFYIHVPVYFVDACILRVT